MTIKGLNKGGGTVGLYPTSPDIDTNKLIMDNGTYMSIPLTHGPENSKSLPPSHKGDSRGGN